MCLVLLVVKRWVGGGVGGVWPRVVSGLRRQVCRDGDDGDQVRYREGCLRRDGCRENKEIGRGG